LLALELQELSVELNFDVTLTGFETADVDPLIKSSDESVRDAIDDVPETDRSIPSVSRVGDIWQIGDHVLLCGDALETDNYAKLLGPQKAEMVFIGPPCGAAFASNEYRGFAGKLNREEYTGFLETTFFRLIDFSVSGSIHFVCMDWGDDRVRRSLTIGL
jgi:hypothetical protein